LHFLTPVYVFFQFIDGEKHFLVFGFLLKNEHPAFLNTASSANLAQILPYIPIFARGNFLPLTLKFKMLFPNIMTLRISGLIQSTMVLHEEMAEICSNTQSNKSVNFSNPRVIIIHEQITRMCKKVEEICLKNKGTPADLPNPSYLTYQWLHFLSEKKWLLSHLHGLVEFQEILKIQGNKPLSRINPANVYLELKNFNYLFRLKQKKQVVWLEINESFISAPREIKELLCSVVFGGGRSKKNHLLKEYTKSQEYLKINQALQSDNNINQISQKGRFFDLEEIFDTLNQKYFKGMLDRSRLTWSARRSRRRLGYYHPESDAITISRSLDDKATQPILIEYILYHEMLHKALGIRESNGRRYAHTREFKNAEKNFEDYNQAVEMMRKFCSSK